MVNIYYHEGAQSSHEGTQWVTKVIRVKIGLISDTHGWIHPRLFEHFKDVDEIWHAGDIGNLETADAIAAFKPLKAVYGNIDGSKIHDLQLIELGERGKVILPGHQG